MPQPLTRRRFLGTLAGATVAAGLYTWRIEPGWLEVVRHDLPIAHLPPGLVGKTLVQLSDIHIGPQVDDDHILDTFATVAELQPDFVVHTGDLVTYEGPAVLEQAKPILEHFPRGKLGTVAILGNHDYGRYWADPKVADAISVMLTNSGCLVLRNERATIAGLTVVGCDDLWTNHFSPEPVMRTLRPSDAALVLCHNPDACDAPVWAGYRGWILSGHTHGGQCKPPFLPPPLLPVGNKRYTAGTFDLAGDRKLYINRGVGHLLRVRFNVRPEVTVFRLTAA
jgi:predicted MPP superfamily phosphohydrolase